MPMTLVPAGIGQPMTQWVFLNYLRMIEGSENLPKLEYYTSLDLSQCQPKFTTSAHTSMSIQTLIESVMKLPNVEVIDLRNHELIEVWALEVFRCYLPKLKLILINQVTHFDATVLSKCLAQGIRFEGPSLAMMAINDRLQYLITRLIAQQAESLIAANILINKMLESVLSILTMYPNYCFYGPGSNVAVERQIWQMVVNLVESSSNTIAPVQANQVSSMTVSPLDCRRFLLSIYESAARANGRGAGPKTLEDWPSVYHQGIDVRSTLYTLYVTLTEHFLWHDINAQYYLDAIERMPSIQAESINNNCFNFAMIHMQFIKAHGWHTYLECLASENAMLMDSSCLQHRSASRHAMRG